MITYIFNEPRLIKAVNFMAALTLAVSLSIPDGYSIGPVFLLLFSLYFSKYNWLLNNDDKYILGVFLLYGVTMLFFVYIDGWNVRELERPSRFIFAIPIFLMFLKLPIDYSTLFWGAMFGSVSAFLLAAYECFYLDIYRAQGAEHPIMFGNIAVLLSAICFVYVIKLYSDKRQLLVTVFSLSGFCGIFASILSGSRGGWIVLPLLIFLLLFYSKKLLGKKKLIYVTIFFILSIFMTVSIPQFGVSARFNQAIDNINNYDNNENRNSSIGARLEMWKAGYYLFLDSPVIGVGEYNSIEKKKGLVEQGLVHSLVLSYRHAHNEYIDALSLRGLVGFILLMLLYLVPLNLFFKKIKQYADNWDIKACAIAGILVPMSYMGFALTQSMFSHNIGVMMYIFPVIYFWSAIRSIEHSQ